MSSDLAPGDFVNPNNVVGAYSASAAATETTPNFEGVTNRFSNNLIYSGSNTFGGTSSNVKAAKGKFVRLTGGSRRRRKGGEGDSTDSPKSDKPITNEDLDEGVPKNDFGEACEFCKGNDTSDQIDPSLLCKECKKVHEHYDPRNKDGFKRRYGGGKNVFARNNKMNGGNRLGMDLENTSASVGTVGAGHPGHKAVDQSAPRQNQPSNKVPASSLTGGKRRRRTRNKRSRKMKTKRHHRRSKGRKSRRNKRRTRRGRKMRGGTLEDGCGCSGGGSRKKRSYKKKSHKRGGGGCPSHTKKNKRGGGGCPSHTKKNKKGGGNCNSCSCPSKPMTGGANQPFSNEPLSFGYSFNGAPINPNNSALASPMPYKPYFACEKVARN